MIEDEIVQWWRDGDSLKRTILRIESDPPKEDNGFPRDGYVIIKLIDNGNSSFIKLSVDEALRLSAQLEAVSRTLLHKKRKLWNLVD